MNTLSTRFSKLRQNTLPPSHRMDAARDLPAKVRKYLEGHTTYITLSPHSRLAGSYAQRTCVGDVKDVDFLVFISGTPEGDDMTPPRRAIADLKDALSGLAEHLGLTTDCIAIETARRSVHVYFKEEDFHLDVVPCIMEDGTDNPLWVPCKMEKKWVKSHPLGYIAKLNEVNSSNGGNVKRLSRMLKHFVQFKMASYNRPKSYWLGALLLQIIEEKGFDTSKTQGQLFNWLVREIRNKYLVVLNTSETDTPNVKDPMLGHNVSWNWKRPAFETFMARLKEAVEWSDKALLDETSEEKAVELWQKIFGADYFPTEIEDEIKAAATKAMPGQSAVSKTGSIVSLLSAASASAVASRPTSFHGGTYDSGLPNVAPPINLGKQQLAMRRHFPDFSCRMEGTTAVWKGRLQPRPGSPLYTVTIRFQARKMPEVRVVSPTIDKGAPHLYPGGLLCLYWPKERNWNSSMFLAETIVPWAAQWLLYYELWQETGEWLGPESPHRYPVRRKDAA